MQQKKNAAESYFPIRVVTTRTGVGAPTLRAWERRYDLLKPYRTPKGHRLYCEQDIQLINRVLSLLKNGHSISSASRLIQTNEAKASKLLIDPAPAAVEEVSESTQATLWQSYIDNLLQAVKDYNVEQLDAVYSEAISIYPSDIISKHLVLPVLDALGHGWQERPNIIAQEHFFSAWLRNKLGARFHHNISLATGNKIIISCAPKQRHEIGALVFAINAMGSGYRTVYLGADMPLEPLPHIAERSAAKAIVIAAGALEDDDGLLDGLTQLWQAASCPVFVGGQWSVLQHDALLAVGITPLGEQLALAMHLLEAAVPVQRS